MADAAKHTPGPWRAHPTGLARSGKTEHEIHWSDDGECVAEVVHGEVDARLIAAAPELLDALKQIIRFGWPANIETNPEARLLGGKKPSTADVWTFPKHMLSAIEAAIAKAEGRA